MNIHEKEELEARIEARQRQWKERVDQRSAEINQALGAELERQAQAKAAKKASDTRRRTQNKAAHAAESQRIRSSRSGSNKSKG